MDNPVRLFGRLHLHGRDDRRVESIRLRIRCPLPIGATVRVADVQLQPGSYVTGWTLHPSDLGVRAVEGWAWRNAVVVGDQQLVITADTPSASPTLWDVRGDSPNVRVGRYFFGTVIETARVDGEQHTATQGAGIPPHLTERADLTVAVHSAGRVLLCSWHRGIATAGDPGIDTPPPAHTDGPLLTAHPQWGQALALHDTLAELLTAHPDWS